MTREADHHHIAVAFLFEFLKLPIRDHVENLKTGPEK